MAEPNEVHLEMPEQNHYTDPPREPYNQPPPVNASSNPSLNVSRSSLRTDDMSDYGADRETIGMRYACPNLGCSPSDKKVYSNPKYANSGVPGKKRYPTLDRPPSRAGSQTTVQSTNQSTADLVGDKKGDPAASGPLSKFKAFWKDPSYDKVRAIVLIAVLLILLLLIIILPITLRRPASEPEVEVPPEYEVVTAPLALCGNREIEGYKKEGVAEYRGMPYAVPPLKENRWKPAVLMDEQNCQHLHYTKANHFGHQCYQSSVIPPGSMESEDCLYVNVWTPSNSSASTKLPVMVWFHGGDFRYGSGHDISVYPLRTVVREGQFVLVSMNYRLQALGFMALNALPDSNVGLSDMIAALKWVQGNIAGFGGDKSKVTAFGLGSGATAIMALMNSPSATGLFQRAWLMSPGIVQDKPLADSKTANVEFLRNIGCELGDDESVKKCLYDKTADQILKAVPLYTGPQWAQPMRFDVPEKDKTSGAYIVTDNLVGGVGTFTALTNKTLVNKQVQVIIGSADADADVRPPAAYFGDGMQIQYLSDDQIRVNVTQRLQAFSPDIMARIQNHYPNLETEQGFTRLVTDIRALCPVSHVADHLSKLGTTVYRYIYELPPDMKLKAFNYYDFWARHSFHGIDMLAFFGTIEGDELSPFFMDGKGFAKGLRDEIYKFIKGETMSWKPVPSFMKLTKSSNVEVTNDALSSPRNCTLWSELNMIPTYSWSN